MEVQGSSTAFTVDFCFRQQLINERAAAEFIGYSCRALQNWRIRGGGPVYVRVSKRSIRYRRCDLIAWAEKNLRTSTSEISQ
jgi:hypothetical protein